MGSHFPVVGEDVEGESAHVTAAAAGIDPVVQPIEGELDACSPMDLEEFVRIVHENAGDAVRGDFLHRDPHVFGLLAFAELGLDDHGQRVASGLLLLVEGGDIERNRLQLTNQNGIDAGPLGDHGVSTTSNQLRLHALGQPVAAGAPAGLSPIVYRLDLSDAKSYLLAKRFPVRDRDIIFIAEAKAVLVTRALQAVSQITGPVTRAFILCRASGC